MKRQATPDAPAEQAQGPVPAFDLALDAARGGLGGAAALLEWLGRWQAATTQALLNQHQAVQAARLDLAQARDGSALLAVQAQLATRQFELALEQAGSAWRLLLEDELRAAEQLRDEAVALGERALSSDDTATLPLPGSAGPDQAFRAWQHAGLELAQRWAEAVNGAVRR